MLKRTSGTRHLPIFSNMNSRAARVELLKKTGANNNSMGINVFENNAPMPNIVSSTPSGASPVLTARSVRHLPGTHKHTFNVRNTAQPSRAALIGKQTIQTLKMNRRRRRRNTRRH